MEEISEELLEEIKKGLQSHITRVVNEKFGVRSKTIQPNEVVSASKFISGNFSVDVVGGILRFGVPIYLTSGVTSQDVFMYLREFLSNEYGLDTLNQRFYISALNMSLGNNDKRPDPMELYTLLTIKQFI